MKNSKFILAIVVCLSVLTLSSCQQRPVLSWAPSLAFNVFPLGSDVLSRLCSAQTDTSAKTECYVDSQIPSYSHNAYVKSLPTSIENACRLFFLGIHDELFSSMADVTRFDLALKTMHASEFSDFDWVKGDTFCIETFVQDFNSGSQRLAEITDAKTGDKYYLPKTLCSRYFTSGVESFLKETYAGDSLDYEVLAYADGKPIAVTLSNELGGQITLVSTPLLFSNFSLLFNKKENARLVLNITREAGFYVHEAKKEHLLEPIEFVCLSNYQANDYMTDRYSYETPFELDDKVKGKIAGVAKDAAKDMFTHFLYSLSKIILFFLMAVFSVFLLRRKQQIIPSFHGYRNRTAQYVHQVGLLYYNEGDFQTILKNKIVFFYADVNERLHIQLSDTTLESQNASYLAAALSIDNILNPFLHKANLALNKKLKVDKRMLEDMSQKMTVMSNILRGDQQQEVLKYMFLNDENNKV